VSIEQRRPPSELDEFLTRAVDRQIAEQRALREALTELTGAVRELADRPPLDVDALAEHVQTITQNNQQAISAEFRQFHETTLPSVERALDAARGVRAMEEEVGAVRDTVSVVSTDVEGIAQALIELNAGLREWSDGVDRNIAGATQAVRQLRESVEHYREIAEREPERQSPLAAPIVNVDTGPLVDQPEYAEAELLPVVVPPVDPEVVQRTQENVEMILHLADQIEDFDGVITRMADLPLKLEGVISQALRRAMAGRAKLDRDAEVALDDIVATLDEHVAKMSSTVESFTEKEEALRKLTLGQVELSSRVESLYSALLERLEVLDADRLRSETALATAIDRSAQGKDPKAVASLDRVSRKRSPAKKPTVSKQTGRKPAPKPAKATRRQPARRRAPKASGDTPAD
jgi:hypothetical protein